jgi:hypothetical protein
MVAESTGALTRAIVRPAAGHRVVGSERAQRAQPAHAFRVAPNRTRVGWRFCPEAVALGGEVQRRWRHGRSRYSGRASGGSTPYSPPLPRRITKPVLRHPGCPVVAGLRLGQLARCVCRWEFLCETASPPFRVPGRPSRAVRGLAVIRIGPDLLGRHRNDTPSKEHKGQRARCTAAHHSRSRRPRPNACPSGQRRRCAQTWRRQTTAAQRIRGLLPR